MNDSNSISQTIIGYRFEITVEYVGDEIFSMDLADDLQSIIEDYEGRKVAHMDYDTLPIYDSSMSKSGEELG
jgi:hypothetical protein